MMADTTAGAGMKWVGRVPLLELKIGHRFETAAGAVIQLCRQRAGSRSNEGIFRTGRLPLLSNWHA